MIRVGKSNDTPRSLLTTKAYDGEDVKRRLLSDQNNKCYLCEHVLHTDFQVEHHKSQKFYPALYQEWNNLFLACSYCNGKKGEYFDDMLYPVDIDIEDEIEHGIDFGNKKAIFRALKTGVEHDETISLLNKLHNGTRKMRNSKEEKFFEHIIEVVNDFYQLVNDYLAKPSEENCEMVREELHIDKEYLGFKYWIIKSNKYLYERFANDIIWNKNKQPHLKNRQL